MNKASTVKLLETQRFLNLKEVSPDLIRAEKYYRDKPIGVFYFDFTGDVIRPGFNIQSYQQKQIASDFYKNEGSLQWNYYLNFVLEKAAYKAFQKEPQASHIESDRVFARKRIWSQESLNAELAQPFAAIVESTKPTQDIASKWVVELQKVGLGSVCDSKAQYDPTVREYLKAGPKIESAQTSAAIEDVPNGRIIKHLQREQFRSHPKKQEFEFGLVNLIRGPNGTGKTSLLEAIELCICGGNRRQNGKTPNGAKLRLEFIGGEPSDIFPGTTSSSYRARDRAWYGGYYPTGNELCQNFGRFNFFDADASFQLSSAKSASEILKAINALLLGEYATTIEERMVSFQERFAREKSDLQRRTSQFELEASKAFSQIAEVKKIKDTRDVLLRELQSKATNVNWRKAPTKLTVDDLETLHESVEDVATSLNQYSKRLSWLPGVTLESLNRDLKHLNEGIQEIRGQRDLAATKTTAQEKARASAEEIESEIKLLERLQQYHRTPNGFSLLGLNTNIKEVAARLSQLKEAETSLRAVDLDKLDEIHLEIGEALAYHNNELTKLRRNLAKSKSRLATLQHEADSIKNLSEQIKGLGQRYCELSPHSTNCPLCDTPFESLASRIASLRPPLAKDTSVAELVSSIDRMQFGLVEIQKTSEGLNRIQNAVQILFPDKKSAEFRVDAAIKALGTFRDLVNENKKNLEQLNLRKKTLGNLGFEEDDLKSLLEAAAEFSRTPSRLKKADDVNLLLSDSKKAQEKIKIEIRENEKILKDVNAMLSRMAKKFVTDFSDDFEVELERRKTLIEEVLREMRIQQKIVTILDQSEFSTVADQLQSFAESLLRIQEALKRIEEKDALEQRFVKTFNDAKAQVAILAPRLSHATTALDTLDKLLGKTFKAEYIESIVEEHKEKLTSIFCKIHAPYEFQKVQIDASVLLKRENGAMSPISEISSGQRSALALSIFLSLNSSVSRRAPWLLFDDPVAHVDDLNVLSFFDMLRDLVLLGTRQVFFATASTRIADLFKKKFDFLDNQFQEFRFER